MQGLTAKVSCNHNFRATSGKTTAKILCPNINGNKKPNIQMVFEIDGWAEAVSYEGIGLDIHALSGADTYNNPSDGNVRQFNVEVKVGTDANNMEAYGTLTDIDIAKNVGTKDNVHKIWKLANKKTLEVKGKLRIELNITAGTKNDGSFFKDTDLFGLVALKGKPAQGADLKYLVVGAQGELMEASTQVMDDEKSSAIRMEEVDYANQPELKAISGDMVKIDGATSIATFSAPFATEVPATVKAYAISQVNEGVARLVPVEGIVPASLGVILAGTELGTVRMVPSVKAGEVPAANLLRSSAGAPHTIAAGEYILSQVGNQVGFYKGKLNSELAMNKSYLFWANDGNAVKLVWNDDVTGVDGVTDGQSQEAPIYDLGGRRVQKVVKGGVYIRNGKKFVVK